MVETFEIKDPVDSLLFGHVWRDGDGGGIEVGVDEGVRHITEKNNHRW